MNFLMVPTDYYLSESQLVRYGNSETLGERSLRYQLNFMEFLQFGCYRGSVFPPQTHPTMKEDEVSGARLPAGKGSKLTFGGGLLHARHFACHLISTLQNESRSVVSDPLRPHGLHSP